MVKSKVPTIHLVREAQNRLGDLQGTHRSARFCQVHTVSRHKEHKPNSPRFCGSLCCQISKTFIDLVLTMVAVTEGNGSVLEVALSD